MAASCWQVLRFCRARRLGVTLSVPPTSALRKHVLALEQNVAMRAAAVADGTKLLLVKQGARIAVLKTRARLHLPRAIPDQALFALLLARMPRSGI